MRQVVAVSIFFLSQFIFIFPAHSRLDIWPSTVYFHHTQVGRWDVNSVTVRNVGPEEQRIFVGNGSCFMDFEVRSSCFGTLRQYERCQIEVWFRPRYEGYANCNFNITSNNSSQSVNVSGYGYRR